MADGLDVFAFDKDVRTMEISGGDDGSVLDEECHDRSYWCDFPEVDQLCSRLLHNFIRAAFFRHGFNS